MHNKSLQEEAFSEEGSLRRRLFKKKAFQEEGFSRRRLFKKAFQEGFSRRLFKKAFQEGFSRRLFKKKALGEEGSGGFLRNSRNSHVTRIQPAKRAEFISPARKRWVIEGH